MYLTSPHSRHTRLAVVVVVSWAWAIDVSSRVKEEPAKDRAPPHTDRPAKPQRHGGPGRV
jgi:hypothetical protein